MCVCLQVTYAPTSITLPSTDYNQYKTTCSSPLPPQYSTTATKRFIQNNQGYLMLSCAMPGTYAFNDYKLTFIPEAGVYTCQYQGVTYVVIIYNNVISVQPCYLSSYNQQVVVYTVDTEGYLCSCSYDVQRKYVQLTRCSQTVRILQLLFNFLLCSRYLILLPVT